MNRFLYAITLVILCFSYLSGQTEPVLKGCHMVHPDYVPVPGGNIVNNLGPDTRSDSIDILDYHIRIDVSTPNYITAHTTVSLQGILDDVKSITLDLLDLTVDSLFVGGEKADYDYDGFQIRIPLSNVLIAGEINTVDVYYQGVPTIDPGNFGGLAFDQGYIYNLGIGISSNPHNFGRGWFPCFDNFVERSTYEYEVTHTSSTVCHCVGTDMGVESVGGGKSRTTYIMSQQIPTYLSGIAISNYHTIWSEYQGIESTYPIKLMSKAADTTNLKNAFKNLPNALEALESWYGPYVWERVGYVITVVGAMEHPTNIAYPASSISAGNADGNTRLMSHELAHHWWGNLVTLSTEQDMWIKEGNAEYGYHLTAEHIYGVEEFRDVVRSNHAHVLNNAHRDDDGFRALSGMPNEYTYGTTTYNKGASVMHNLRGYMGDEMFKLGMNSILQNYAFSHLDAIQFRDQLEATTGLNMHPFFDAWIFEPGFAAYVIDSLEFIDQTTGINNYRLHLQQKLYGTEKFHEEVPVSIDFLGIDGELEVKQFSASGQFYQVDVEVPFEVKRTISNRNNLLNIARTDGEEMIDETKNIGFANTKINMKVNSFSEPFWARVEHVYGSPDQYVISEDYSISKTHYWTIDADFPQDYDVEIDFKYDGSDEAYLDYDLTGVSEDSLLLFYRPDASFAWAPVENVHWIVQVPNDGKGQFRLNDVKAGQYCFGKGVLMVSTETVEMLSLEVFPNPASEVVYVNLANESIENLKSLTVYNALGQEVDVFALDAKMNSITYPTNHLVNGQYYMQLRNRENRIVAVQALSIQHGED